MTSLNQLLKHDPFAEAERITGKRWSEDPTDATSFLGLAISMQHGARTDAALTSMDDTTFSNQLDNYLRIVKSEGFEEVLRIPFAGSGVNETFFIFYHRIDGILLQFDTFNAKSVNGGTFYYTIKPHDKTYFFREVVSTGGYIDDETVQGSHDCREAFRHKLAQLREHGTFVVKWPNQPFLWLLHYMDTKDDGYDYKAINAARIAMLPQDVQANIRGEKE